MKKSVGLLFIFWMVVSTSLLYAQDDPETRAVQLPNGQTINLPLDWEFEEQGELYIFWANEVDFIKFMLPENTAAYYADLPSMPTATDLLISLTEGVYTTATSEEDIVVVDGSAEFLRIDEGVQHAYHVIEWNGGFLYIEILSLAEDAESMNSVADDLLAQFLVRPACFASTDKRWGASLRLGPHINRGEYTTLMPADGEVGVLAQHTAVDGMRWWRVEENYEAVDELWVAAADVITAGSCEAVEEYAGQPVIPPQGILPPAGNNGSGSLADTGLVPANGTWYWVVSPTMVANCEGRGTTQAQTPDGILLEGNVALTASADGTAIAVSGASRTLVFTGADGYYEAEIVTENRYIIARMHVSSPTSMTVEVSVALLNRPCSGMVTVTTTYIG